jgi:hypothetical protein
VASDAVPEAGLAAFSDGFRMEETILRIIRRIEDQNPVEPMANIRSPWVPEWPFVTVK